MSTLLIVHVAISLFAIASGLVVVTGLIANETKEIWTRVFLATAILTNLTGFLFPITALTPALTLGILSSIVLAPVLLARYTFHLAGAWRWVYVVGAVLTLYFNLFVLVVQAFLKVPALHVLAPTQAEPPFTAAQGVVLIAMAAAGLAALRKFRPAAGAPAAPRVAGGA